MSIAIVNTGLKSFGFQIFESRFSRGRFWSQVCELLRRMCFVNLMQFAWPLYPEARAAFGVHLAVASVLLYQFAKVIYAAGSTTSS